ncbi:transmembrane and coiled-coil domain-containing protein 4 [Quercus suber]|uniref:Transmembrane and coiled-coil domain-containing protein 4 n=1 Tax=Quercus suber TaxID=58331 RepID=A0AAW0MAP6_QUESU
MKQGAMMTVLSTLVAALALPATLITTSDLIDSKWAIAVDRLVTLIGFSLRARVIFKCLHCLANAEGDNAGLVERVVLLGAPVSIKDENWEEARKWSVVLELGSGLQMVAVRFVNAYSTTDWTLGIIFRASLLSQGLAGIQPVDVPGIENVRTLFPIFLIEYCNSCSYFALSILMILPLVLQAIY